MTAPQKEELYCPKCLGILENKEVGEMEKKPVRIDQCSMCKGIWFDEGELKRVLKLKLGFDDEEAEEEFHQDWKDDVFDLKQAQCPRCKKVMQRTKSSEDDRVIIDCCLDCGGLWLDGGEIRELMRGGPIHRALKFILSKLSEPFKNS